MTDREPSPTTRYWSRTALPDRSSYFGGFKEDRVLSWGPLKRALSDHRGQYEGATFSWIVQDSDRVIRALLNTLGDFLNWNVVWRVISDESRRLLGIPRVILRGVIRTWKPLPEKRFRLNGTDLLERRFATTADKRQVPHNRIRSSVFTDVSADIDQGPESILFGDMTDSGSVTLPPEGLLAQFAPLGNPRPVPVVGTPDSGGGNLPSGETYFYHVVANFAGGGRSSPTPIGSATVLGAPGEAGTGHQLELDETIEPPKHLGSHHVGGGSITKYRWTFVTAILNGKESNPSGVGAVNGEDEPNVGAFSAWKKAPGSPDPDSFRMYMFNGADHGGLGLFHPQNNPSPPADPVPPLVIQFESIPFSPANFGGWPEYLVGDATHENVINSDSDGTDYLSTVGGSANITVGHIDLAWTEATGATSYDAYFSKANPTLDPTVADVRVVNVTAPTLTLAITDDDQGSAASFYESWVYVVTARMIDGETKPSDEVTARSFPHRRPILLTWAAINGAIKYNVYRRSANGTFDKVWVVADPTFIDDLLNTGALTVDGLNLEKGLVPVTHLGTETISGVQWNRFLVAGHACKEIVNWFVDGEKLPILTAALGEDWLVPGFAGWTDEFGSTLFREFGGRRYCIIYVRNSAAFAHIDGTALITVNVRGIESVGDGTGTLLTDGLDQYQHFMQQYAFSDYQTGDWATPPVFEDDATLAIVDDTTFTASKLISAGRITGGYVNAWGIGLNNAFVTMREQIARFNLSNDCDSGWNRRMQFMVSMVPDDVPTLLAAAGTHTEAFDIAEDSFDIDDEARELFNGSPYTWAWNPRENKFEREDEETDAVSIARTGETKPAQLISLYGVRSNVVASDIAFRRLTRNKFPPRRVRFKLPATGLNDELGDIRLVTHSDGIGSGGWVNNPVRIIRHETFADNFSVEVTALDLGRLFEGAFILGDETVLPAAWTSATEAEKRYGYLCDETTGLFSDGAKGKRVR